MPAPDTQATVRPKPFNENERIYLDKACPEVYAALIETSKAVRDAAAAAGLDKMLIELVNLRVSQINGCAYCLDAHAKVARRLGETIQRMSVLSAWRDAHVFTPREQAALALAESVTDLPDALSADAAYRFASERLTPAEVAAVIWTAISMNAFNRMSILSRHPVRPAPELGR